MNQGQRGGECREILPPGGWFQKIFFDGTSRLTRSFPGAGARVLDFTVRPLVGNHVLSVLFQTYNQRMMKRIKSFRRFLVVPDIHIGDSVMTQAALTGVRDFFPEAEVDYVVNKAAYPLIDGNPEASHVFPLFNSGTFPSASDLRAIHDLTVDGEYDLCLNFCPYLRDKNIASNGNAVLNFMSRAPNIILNEMYPAQINHFIYQHYKFTRDLLALVARPVRREPFKGVRLTFSDEAVEEAARLADEANLAPERPTIFLNPDAGSPFTRMPFEPMAALLTRLAELDVAILLGEGHTEAGIGARLKDRVSPRFRSRIKIIPADLSLEAYSALIDFSDVFISGDTGPMHLAAVRRHSRTGRYKFRNRTAVLCVFGATPARMSGYDSFQTGYLPANQDAPSWTFTSESPCRNITCLNKMYKTCRAVRCFEEAGVESIVRRIASHLDFLSRQSPAQRGPATS